MQFHRLPITEYLLLLLVTCSLLPSCSSNQKLTEAISYDSDSTKHVFYYAGKKNKLVKEITYYSNGNLKSEYNFTDSLLNGPFKTFSENGNPLKEGAYLNGMENGLFKYYDINGLLTIEGYLKNGKKEGKWTTWYDDVQKKEEMEYKDDALHGTWTHWFIDGNLMREETYENGKKIKEQVYE
ncbi:MAG: toxin-antitoxin system YwqK family antitoxin [Bacteroidia bacterium]